MNGLVGVGVRLENGFLYCFGECRESTRESLKKRKGGGGGGGGGEK